MNAMKEDTFNQIMKYCHLRTVEDAVAVFERFTAKTWIGKAGWQYSDNKEEVIAKVHAILDALYYSPDEVWDFVCDREDLFGEAIMMAVITGYKDVRVIRGIKSGIPMAYELFGVRMRVGKGRNPLKRGLEGMILYHVLNEDSNIEEVKNEELSFSVIGGTPFVSPYNKGDKVKVLVGTANKDFFYHKHDAFSVVNHRGERVPGVNVGTPNRKEVFIVPEEDLDDVTVIEVPREYLSSPDKFNNVIRRKYNKHIGGLL